MFYKNECRITSLEDMNEGAAQKCYIETGSRQLCEYLPKELIYIKFYITLFVGINDIYDFCFLLKNAR